MKEEGKVWIAKLIITIGKLVAKLMKGGHFQKETILMWRKKCKGRIIDYCKSVDNNKMENAPIENSKEVVGILEPREENEKLKKIIIDLLKK